MGQHVPGDVELKRLQLLCRDGVLVAIRAVEGRIDLLGAAAAQEQDAEQQGDARGWGEVLQGAGVYNAVPWASTAQYRSAPDRCLARRVGGASVTLRRAENQTETVLRQDIEEIQSTGVSLMPEGLEKTITIEEMADLLTFLKNWRYRDLQP